MRHLLWAQAVLAVLLAGCTGKGVDPPPSPVPEKRLRVGFDVDDTLLFSSPAFDKARQTKGVKNYSKAFWRIVNSSDEAVSGIKKKTRQILEKHQAKGDDIFVLTARHPDGGDALRKFLYKTIGVPPENVYFETRGKTKRIKMLRLDIFYGDSDSDISAAMEAGAKAVRILRSPKSGYKGKYNPGKYGEEIIKDSEE
jgi:acid phosphatase (class B)